MLTAPFVESLVDQLADRYLAAARAPAT